MYNIINILLIILIIIGLILIIKKFFSHVLPDNENSEDNETSFDKMFFESVNNGEKYQQIFTISSSSDCSMLRSLLLSAGISTYLKDEHMNNIYGGMSGLMTAIVPNRVYILYKDYDDAISVVKDFLITKIKLNEDKNYTEDMLKFVESLSPSSINDEKEILGIIIYPKADKE